MVLQSQWIPVFLLLCAAANGLQQPWREWRVSLAKKALEDVAWRRAVDKATREVSLSGDPNSVATIRRAQELALALVDEEEFRALQIVSRGGSAVRPLEAPADVRGPLGDLEAKAVDALEASGGNVVLALARWLAAIVQRFDAEVEAVVASETARARRTAATGDRLRPLDAPPSVLGKLELFFEALVREETARASGGIVRRPVENAPGSRGPLAAAERLVEVLCAYEAERLETLRAAGLIQRPMERDPLSALGVVEGATVGVIRAPILVSALVERVTELIEEVKADEAARSST